MPLARQAASQTAGAVAAWLLLLMAGAAAREAHWLSIIEDELVAG